MEDPVAAHLERLAVAGAAVAGDVVAVVADLALEDIDDAVAAGLVRLAVARAAVAALVVAVVAGVARGHVDDVVAAARELAVGPARRVGSVRVQRAAVARLADRRIDDAVAAARELAVVLAAIAVGDVAVVALLARLGID